MHRFTYQPIVDPSGSAVAFEQLLDGETFDPANADTVLADGLAAALASTVPAHIPISVNVEAFQLDQWADQLIVWARRRHLWIEVVERDRHLAARSTLARLADGGVHLVADDLELGELDSLDSAYHVIKTPRSLLTDPHALASIWSYATRHGKALVIEGIETGEEDMLARRFDGALRQGFLHGRKTTTPTWRTRTQPVDTGPAGAPQDRKPQQRPTA